MEFKKVTKNKIGKHFNSRGKRWYHVPDNKSISVTSLLALVKEFDGVAASANYYARNPLAKTISWDKYCKDIMNTGTILHYRIACELARKAGIPPPLMEPGPPLHDYKKEDYELMLSYWEDFKRVCNPMVYKGGLERFVYSSMGFAGRVDCVMTIDPDQYAREVSPYLKGPFKKVKESPKKGDVWVVDFKSSKGIYDGYEAQVYAYFLAWNEMFPNHQANRMAILRMGPNGFEFVETGGDHSTLMDAIEAAKEKRFIRG